VSLSIFILIFLIIHLPRLKRVLNLARNPALDSINDKAFAEKQLKLAGSYQIHCADAVSEASKQSIRAHHSNGYAYKTFRQSLMALGQAGTFRNQVLTQMDKPELSMTALIHRSKREYSTRMCDAIVVIPIPGVLNKIAKPIRDTVDLEDHFILVTHPTLEPDTHNPESNILEDNSTSSIEHDLEKSRKKNTVFPTASSSSSPQSLSPNASHSSSTKRANPQDMFVVSEHTFQTNKARTEESLSASQHTDANILLPVLTAEYRGVESTKALNQTRLCATASLTFLESLGIPDQPLFSLITSGTCGAVCLSWFSSKHDVWFLSLVAHYT
jgi:hypothetical protein